MKVYVVTAGEYSDYHIEKIFSDRESARLYAMMDADRQVEDYDVDDVGVNNTMRYVLIKYNFRYNEIRELTLHSNPEVPHIEDDWYPYFCFTLSLSNAKLYASIIRYGKTSRMIKKITTDKFAEYLYEHGTSRKELLDKIDEQRKPSGYYTMYTTSIKPDPVSNYLTEYINRKLANGEQLPDLSDLQILADKKRKDMENGDS